jgi:DNA-directed RNA polymerase specialized sigma24 family protein|tara:strand:- start:16 stop:354 length:339 start_codon:yes stop_codon:yes gene_type:complete
MFKLVEKYSGHSEQEWTPLFYRILNSRINDWYRRNTVRNRHRSWLSEIINEEAVTNESMDKLQIALEGLPARNTQDQQRIRDVDSPDSTRAPAEQESNPADALTNTTTSQRD